MYRTFLKRFPLFIWLLFASLQCLIPALTQAGGDDLLFRFASSVQSCCGEGWALQANVAVYGEHSPCSGQAASSFGGLSPGAVRLFSPRRAACGLSTGHGAPFPSAASELGSQRLGALSPGMVCLSLRGPSTRRWWGLRKSLDRNWGL